MKFFKRLSLITWLGSFLTLLFLLYASITINHWLWFLTITQLFACYAGAEIVHTMYKKPTMPHPTSLAFQKEILKHYKVK